VKENSIEKLQERLETLHVIQDARLACNADDLDIREEIAEVEEEIKELQDDTNVNRENSIKNEQSSIENIKILEELIENANIENMDMNDCFGGEHIEAIERFLSNYKRILKENEKLKNQEATARKINELLVQRYSNSISVQKVKDKIKEEKMPLTIVGGIRNKKILEYGISLGRMQVLQELLEGRR